MCVFTIKRVVVTLVLGFTTTGAQTPILRLRPAGKDHLGGVIPQVGSAFGDLDKDGDLDLITGGPRGLRVLLNDGAQRFTPKATGGIPPGLAASASPLLLDVDRDGNLDLVVRASFLHLLLGNGKGDFVDRTVSHLGSAAGSCCLVQAGDLTGNGYPDLVVTASTTPPARLLINDGTGRFSDQTATRLPTTTTMVINRCGLGDVDGDGDLDMVGVGSLGVWLFRNDGKGFFPAQSPIAQVREYNLALGDLDGDGDLDLVLPGQGQGKQLCFNDGKGAFSTNPTLGPPFPIDQYGRVALADMDGDLDLDLLASFNYRFRLALNDGKGRFTLSPQSLPTPVFQFSDLDLADLGGDGDLDLLVTGPGNGALLLSDGGIQLRPVNHLPFCDMGVGRHTRGLATADVDSDGDLDLFTSFGPASGLRLGDGTGRFTLAPAGAMPAADITDGFLATGDLDGDGHIDLVTCVDKKRTALFLGDGKGAFKDVSPTHLPADPMPPLDAALADLDRDGLTDILLAREGSQGLYWRNTGKGIFLDRTASAFPSPPVKTSFLACADLDRDGDTDLVCISAGKLFLYFNDGGGRMAGGAANLLPSSWTCSRLILADVEPDGDPDILVSGDQVQYHPFTSLLLGNGKGGFVDATATHLPLGTEVLKAELLLDMNEDGHLDLVYTSYGSYRVGVRFNDGKGRFAVGPWVMEDGFGAMGMGLFGCDADGDGDEDLVNFMYLQGSYRPILLLNHARQLRAPYLAAPGAPFDLEISGPAGAGALVLGALKGGLLALPPFGTLKLDPNSLREFGFHTLSAQGAKTLAFTLPGAPSVLGVELRFQALIVDGAKPMNSRFTNATSDRVGRW